MGNILKNKIVKKNSSVKTVLLKQTFRVIAQKSLNIQNSKENCIYRTFV